MYREYIIAAFRFNHEAPDLHSLDENHAPLSDTVINNKKPI